MYRHVEEYLQIEINVPLQEEQSAREADMARKSDAAQIAAAIEREREWNTKLRETEAEKQRIQQQMRDAEEKKKQEKEKEAMMAALKLQKVILFDKM